MIDRIFLFFAIPGWYIHRQLGGDMSDNDKILRFAVISDTHGKLPPALFETLEGVERIYHCGDVGTEKILCELRAIAPVSAVAGNMDPWALASVLPETRIEEAAFGKVLINHGASFSHNNLSIASGLLELYDEEAPRVILFGHSHEPMVEKRRKTLIINPGSLTLPVSGDPATYVIMEYDSNKDVLSASVHRLVEAID